MLRDEALLLDMLLSARQTIDAVYEARCCDTLTPLTGVPERGAVWITVTIDEPTRPSTARVGILPDADADETRNAIEHDLERAGCGSLLRQCRYHYCRGTHL
jgi:hypothetical protein